MTSNDSSSEIPAPNSSPETKKPLDKQVQQKVIRPLQNQVIPGWQRFSDGLKAQYRKIDLKNESRQRRVVVATLMLLMVWLLLVGKLSWSEILVGFIVAVFTTWLASHQLTFIDNLKFSWAMPWYILRYLQVFVVALLRANIDMARRVLSPRLPINPALVTVQTQLNSPLGKFILANSITLTPGTLTVDVVGKHLQVHWIDSTPGVDLEHATHAIAESFERHLRELVE